MASTSISVQPVVTPKQRRQFTLFPYRFYRGHPHWVPPLLSDQKVLHNPDKHPFYSHTDSAFFLAYRDGAPAGRIAAFVDRTHNDFHSEKTGFFGFFESEDDTAVASSLLDSARSWVREQGMEQFRGPVNPSQNEDCGLLLDAYDKPPVIMMPYNPPYYRDLLEQYGLEKKHDLYAYYIDGQNPPPEKLVRVAEKLRTRENISIHTIDMKNFDAEAEKVWYVYNNAWSKNFGFVPMTRDEFKHLAKHLKSVVVPELALIAEIGGYPIGFSISLPDLNQALIHTNGRLFPTGLPKLLWHSRKIDMVRIIIMGVIHEHQRKGIDSIFYLDTWRNAVKKGYWRGEMSWILDNNEMMNRAARMLGGKIYKTYRLYEMKA